MSNRGPLGIIACEAGRPFAEKILDSLKQIIARENAENHVKIIDTRETHFANTEIKTEINESIRGCDIYIVQAVENSTLPYSVNDNFMALISAIDAAKRCDAHYVTVVLPVFPYARQDKAVVREGITASTIARQLESAGADRIVTLDVHNEAIAGFLRTAKFENLHASKNIMEHVRSKIGVQNLVVVSPDLGGASRANYYAKELGAGLAMFHKERDYSSPSKVDRVTLLENVDGKNVLFVDDMISTGGTAVKTMELLKKQHKPLQVHFACSLPLFNGKAKELLAQAHKDGIVTSVIGTDAVYHGEEFLKQNPWYKEVSVAKYFARVIFNINHYMSLSELLK